MNKLIICQYVNKLKKEDIIKFGIKEGIIIREEEVEFIYNYIKENYEKIIDNPSDILTNIKDKVSNKVYQKILELYNKYKDMLDNKKM